MNNASVGGSYAQPISWLLELGTTAHLYTQMKALSRSLLRAYITLGS